MEARTARSLYAITFVVSILWPLSVHAAGSARTQNFVVSAPTQALAREIAEQAERLRRELAVSWLGKELPPWQDPCPVYAKVDPRLGAGGATSFLFETESRQFARPVGDGLFQSKPAGRPFGWEMTLQGSRERVLDSVLPHEVTHTIFATHFGRPLPRWADEGACTTVEHESEKSKQRRMLYEFLTTERGIPFNQMFAMTEYPKDILPLYSQGFSLARFLIQQGGRRKFVDYVGAGLNSNNWTETTRQFYGFPSISDLQITWLDWVRNGSQTPATPATESHPPQTLLAANQNHQSGSPNSPEAGMLASTGETQSAWTVIPVASRSSSPSGARAGAPNSKNPIGQSQLANRRNDVANVAGGASWYARQKTRPRNERLARGPAAEQVSGAARTSPVSANGNADRRAVDAVDAGVARVASRPDANDVEREVLLEWGEPSSFDSPRLSVRRDGLHR